MGGRRPATRNSHPAPKGRRWGRRLAMILTLLIGLPLAALGTGLALLKTDTGLEFLRGQLTGVLSEATGYGVAIDAIAGDLLGAGLIRGVVVQDETGPWLRVATIEFDWHPSALLDGRLEVSRLRIGAVALDRAPLATAAPSETAETTGLVLPIDLDLLDVSVDPIVLGAAVLGQETRLAFSGSLRLHEGSQAELRALLDHLGDSPGRLSLTAGYDLANGTFDLEAEVFDGAGGLLAHLLDQPDLPPTDLRLTGEGSLEAWTGRLAGSLGSLATADLALSIGGPSPWRVALDGTATLGDLLSQDLQPLFGSLTIAAALSLGEDGRLQAQRLDIEAGPAALALTGWLDPDRETIDLAGRLEITDGQGLPRTLFPGDVAAAVARIAVRGPVAAPTGDLALVIEGLALEGFRSAQLAADLRFAPDETGPAGTAFMISGQGTVAQPDLGDDDLNRLIGGPLDWSLQGRLPLDGEPIDLASVALSSPTAALEGSGSLDPGSFAGQGRLSYRIPALAALLPPGTPAVSGGTSGEIAVVLTDKGRVEAQISGALADLDSGDPLFQALLGATPRYGLTVQVEESGALAIDDLKVAGAGSALAGKARLGPAGEKIDAEVQFDLADLGPIGTLFEVPLAGRLATVAKVGGLLANPDLRLDVTAPELVIAGNALPDFRLGLEALRLLDSPAGGIALETVAADQRIRAESQFQLVDDRRLVLTNLKIATDQGDRLSGELSWPLGGATLSGDLGLELADLTRWEAVMGTRLSGALRANLTLNERASQQDATVVIEAENLALADGGGPWQLATLRATGETADLWGRAETTLDLSAEGPGGAEAAAGAKDRDGLARLSATGRGNRESFALSLAASGALGQAFDLAGDLEVAAAPAGLALTARAARLSYGPVRGALERPLRITFGDQGLAVADLALALEQGRAVGALTLGPEQVVGDLTLEDIPLGLLTAAGSATTAAPALEGVLDLRLRLEGRSDDPTGTLVLGIEGLRSREAAAANLPPGRLTATASLDRGQASLTAELAGLASVPLRASAKVPLEVSLLPFAVNLPRDGALAGQLQWAGDARDIVTLMAFDRVSLQGAIEADITLGGTISAPTVGGALELRGGRYENFTLGTILEELTLRVAPRGSQVTLEMAGRDPLGGTLAVAGQLDVSRLDDPRFDATATMTSLLAAQRDDVTATVSGAIRAAGTLDRSTVTGTVTGDRIDLRLVDTLPPSVVELPVVDPALGPTDQAPGTSTDTPSPRVALDLVLDLPSRVYVQGRGLDSEWAGRFHVGGSEVAPLVTGQIAPVRGTFDFFGKRFRLGAGQIALGSNGDDDPVLNLTASHSSDDLVTTVTVTGAASRPEIAFSSQPPLPQEEILSRLLFDRSSAQLDPLQAVQLAQAAATLSGYGGGGGLLDLARSTLGVDVLAFAPGAEGELGRLEAGKYLTDRVYLGVEQGAVANSTEATVEVEVTPNVSVRTGVGADQSGKAKVQFKWDY